MTARSSRSCCDGESRLVAADRQLIGERRRVLVRRLVLAASAGLCGAAVAILWLGGAQGDQALARRLAWGAAACAAGLAAGWARQAMTTHRPGWRLLAAVAALAAGIGWQPLVPAILAVAALAESVLRPAARGPAPARTTAPFQPAAAPGTDG